MLSVPVAQTAAAAAATDGERFPQLTMQDLAASMASSDLRDPYDTIPHSPRVAERPLPPEDHSRS